MKLDTMLVTLIFAIRLLRRRIFKQKTFKDEHFLRRLLHFELAPKPRDYSSITIPTIY
jgi:hypothetical protein